MPLTNCLRGPFDGGGEACKQTLLIGRNRGTSPPSPYFVHHQQKGSVCSLGKVMGDGGLDDSIPAGMFSFCIGKLVL